MYLLAFSLLLAAPEAVTHAARVLDAVPDVVQTTDYTCGPAALVAVLRYYGIAATEKTVTRAAKTDPESGAEMEDLARVAERHGLKAEIREHLELSDVLAELDAGRPVIVLVQAWREDPKTAWHDDWDDGHYLVVIGLDPGRVTVEDPSLEGARGTIPCAEFVERWHGWTIDERRTTGQALLIRGGTPRAKPARVPKLEPVE